MNWQERLTGLGVQLARTNYSSARSVREHNAAAEELRNIIFQIGATSDTALDEVLTLLADANLRAWIAFTILELDQIPSEQRERCIAVIRELAEGKGHDALAAQWWLRDNRN